MTAQLFAANHASLLAHAGRLLRMAELTGDLPSQVVEAGDLVDEVARIVLDPQVATRKPAHLSYQQWFFQLLQQEVDRQVQHFAEEMRVRADGGELLSPAIERENGQDSEPLANLWRERIEPAEALLPEEQIADEETLPPDSAFAGQELVACLQQDVKSWPAIERQIFELHYLVGLEVGDIAQITRKLQIEVQAVIRRIEIRLRDFLRHAVSAP